MSTQKDSDSFRIGAVERLSGVPAVTIRMWERRYQAVTPERSAAGGRIFSVWIKGHLFPFSGD